MTRFFVICTTQNFFIKDLYYWLYQRFPRCEVNRSDDAIGGVSIQKRINSGIQDANIVLIVLSSDLKQNGFGAKWSDIVDQARFAHRLNKKTIVILSDEIKHDLPRSAQNLLGDRAPIVLPSDGDFKLIADELHKAIEFCLKSSKEPTPSGSEEAEAIRDAGRRQSNTALFVGILGAAAAIVAAFVVVVAPLLVSLSDSASRTATEVSITQVAIITPSARPVLSSTPRVLLTESPSFTSPQPTGNPPEPQGPISNEVIEIARRGVTSNAQWRAVDAVFDGVPMVLVPRGCFTFGSTAEQITHAEETLPAPSDVYDWLPFETERELCLDQPFWIDKYEVSNEQFIYFGGVSSRNSEFKRPLQPRDHVNWHEAKDFCEEKRPGNLTLPTEEQWEFAARGPDSLIYPWGNEWIFDGAAWIGTSGQETSEIGSFPKGVSWTGALDMSGNVWEWTLSRYEPNNTASLDYVIRSGSFGREAFYHRSAIRDAAPPDSLHNFRGIRCARPLWRWAGTPLTPAASG